MQSRVCPPLAPRAGARLQRPPPANRLMLRNPTSTKDRTMTVPLELSPARQRSLAKLARKELRRARAWRRDIYFLRSLAVVCLLMIPFTLSSALPTVRPAAAAFLLFGLILSTSFLFSPSKVPAPLRRPWHEIRDIFGMLWESRRTIHVPEDNEELEARRIVHQLFANSRSPEAGRFFADRAVLDVAVDAAVVAVIIQTRSSGSRRTSPLAVAGALDAKDSRGRLAEWAVQASDRELRAIVEALKLRSNATLEQGFLAGRKLLRGRLGTAYL